MHYKKKKPKTGRNVLVAILVLALLGSGAFFWLRSRGADDKNPESKPEPPNSVPVSSEESQPETSQPNTEPEDEMYTAIPLPEEMRAMWISFLELENMDLSTEASLRAELGPMLDNCKAWGLNTAIVIVRPFSDALYESSIYPWSHLITGTQGQNPGYDPLAVMVEEAHARGLRLEAWINPYRVRLNSKKPSQLAANNAAVLNPAWAVQVGDALWYDPGHPEVRQMLVNGVREIVQKYDVDGIHFDDYFYPTFANAQEDEAFDAETFAAYGGGATRAEWRRANVTALVGEAYRATKEENASVSFGISPAGNDDNNYNLYYFDTKQLIANSGYMDYIMPQLYWGFGWQDKNGKDTFAFQNIAAEWAAYPRAQGVRLFAGLGTYRIGVLQPDGTRKEFGDSQYGDQTMWSSGRATADLIEKTRSIQGFSGFGVYRYAYLVMPDDPISAAEAAAMSELLNR